MLQQPLSVDISEARPLPEELLTGSQAQSIFLKLLHRECLIRPIVAANLAVVEPDSRNTARLPAQSRPTNIAGQIKGFAISMMLE